MVLCLARAAATCWRHVRIHPADCTNTRQEGFYLLQHFPCASDRWQKPSLHRGLGRCEATTCILVRNTINFGSDTPRKEHSRRKFPSTLIFIPNYFAFPSYVSSSAPISLSKSKVSEVCVFAVDAALWGGSRLCEALNNVRVPAFH